MRSEKNTITTQTKNFSKLTSYEICKYLKSLPSLKDVSSVEINFSGSGDEGSVTEILYSVKSDIRNESTALIFLESGNVYDIFSTIFEDLESKYMAGWQDDLGAYGSIKIDLVGERIKIELNHYIEETVLEELEVP